MSPTTLDDALRRVPVLARDGVDWPELRAPREAALGVRAEAPLPRLLVVPPPPGLALRLLALRLLLRLEAELREAPADFAREVARAACGLAPDAEAGLAALVDLVDPVDFSDLVDFSAFGRFADFVDLAEPAALAGLLAALLAALELAGAGLDSEASGTEPPVGGCGIPTPSARGSRCITLHFANLSGGDWQRAGYGSEVDCERAAEMHIVKVGVLGHVEWVEFVTVMRVPRAGEVAHGVAPFTRAAGGGGVAAVVLAGLAESVEFFLSLGRDAVGAECEQELASRGVTTHVGWREQPTRRALTLLDSLGERTIITIGERLEPRGDDALDWSRLAGTAGVYVTAGDREAVRRARQAPVVVATPRARAALEDEALVLDALVYSAGDPDERAWADRVAGRTRLLVATEGAAGGSWRGEAEGRWVAVAPPGPPRDTYGCGDSFAAGLTFGLAGGLGTADAAALAARLGAAALAVSGPP